jgi:hypothetical protein
VKLWKRLLIFLHIRRDWVNEIELAPPAFDSVPHDYDCLRDDGKPLTYCAKCGGGSRHPIHLISKDSLEAGDIVRHHFNHEND